MQTVDIAKKPATETSQDWHPADIVAAIWKQRSSLIRLSRLHGYANGSLRMALRRPWPKAEKLIADFIGLPPQQIWPSRYDEKGKPLSGRNQRGIGRYKAKHSTAGGARNVKEQRAA